MASSLSSWLSGPPPIESGRPEQGPNNYPGQRLGLAESGAGSLARTGRRVAALVIDWFIAYGLAGLTVTLGFMTIDEFRYSGLGATTVLVIWLVLGAVLVRLFSFTPGQFALGLRVVSVDHRLHVGIGRAIARGLLVFLVVPVLFADTDGRGLQDRLTATAVVRR